MTTKFLSHSHFFLSVLLKSPIFYPLYVYSFLFVFVYFCVFFLFLYSFFLVHKYLSLLKHEMRIIPILLLLDLYLMKGMTKSRRVKLTNMKKELKSTKATMIKYLTDEVNLQSAKKQKTNKINKYETRLTERCENIGKH